MDQIKHPSRILDQTYQPPPVRFRAVIEMSFPDADPWDPTDYGSVIEQWRKSLEENTTFNCKDVVIREILTVGGPKDDYEEWRYQSLSDVPPGIRITGKAVAHRRRQKGGRKRSGD
jgi:hypothetical protein